MPDPDPPVNDVLVIVPARSRPDNSVAFAEAFFAHSTRSDLVFALDDDDPIEYPRLEGVRYEINPRLRVSAKLNLVATKYVDQYRYLAFIGDDHRIRTAEWDRLLVEAIEDLPAGIAYGNDLIQGPVLPTTVLMKADVVRVLGFMAPPSLVHLYIDNVWRDLGSALGSLRYRNDVILEHLHPSMGKAEEDALYREAYSAEAWERDSTAYQRYLRTGLQMDTAKLKLLLTEEHSGRVPDANDVPGDPMSLPIVLNATYGTESCGVDVTERFQDLVRAGSSIMASNDLFGDPCPGQVKRLRFTYQLPGDDRVYTQEVPEHQTVLLPSTDVT